MKLLHKKEEEIFCTKNEFLICMLTVSLVKLDMIGARLDSNVLIFSGDILLVSN